MSEKPKATAEMLWQDEKDFLTVLYIGIRDVITLLREPFDSNGIATVHSLEPNRPHTPQLDRKSIYPIAV